MSSSRLREQPPTIFDVFCELEISDNENQPRILWKYPEDFDDSRTLKIVSEFAFPTSLIDTEAVQLFTFVLTDNESRYSFGYCRHTPSKRNCLCVLSALPWTDVFYRLLNHTAGMLKKSHSPGKLTPEAELLLTRAYHQEIPGPGEHLTLDSGLGHGNKVEFVCPDDKILPRIPDDRNLTEYYNAVNEENMLAIFANLLCERRIMMTSAKLGKLSACILAASRLLYPMHWQHPFVPVLPENMAQMLHMPMPFLVGLPFSALEKLKRERVDLSEIVILNIDTEEYTSPFDDLSEFPGEVVHVLKKNLRSSNHYVGDGVARSFLRALVVLLGGYREALQFKQGERITFKEEAFVASRPASMRKFLEKMLHSQIFHQFIDERLCALNSGEDDARGNEFEEECSLYSSKEYNRFKTQYNEWIKEGGTIFKQFSKKMKSKGREAMSEFRTRITEYTSSGGIIPGRRTPSPSILKRRSPQMPQSQKKIDRASSALLTEETSALNNGDGAEEDEKKGKIFGVGGLDLLKELQEVMGRPSSFVERIETEHNSRWNSAVQNDETGQQNTKLIDVPSATNLENFQAKEIAQNQNEPLLIDFGMEKKRIATDPSAVDMTFFDPLADTKTAVSAPTSPSKNVILDTKKMRNKDLKMQTTTKKSASWIDNGLGNNRSWQTFE